MIKGIVSLFTSGFIFKPVVLSGIILGFISITNLSIEEIKTLITKSQNHLLLLLFVSVYVLIFKKVYKQGGAKIDFFATMLTIVAEFMIFTLSYILSMSFVFILGV